MGKRKHFKHWVIPISLLCNSQFSCVKGQVSIKSHLTRLHQYCPKHWDFPLFLAFKIRKFSWISILLFLLASDLPHWFVLFHSSMITAALVTFSGGSWEVRIRRKRNRKGREKTKTKPSFGQIWLLIHLTSSRIRKPFCTFSSILLSFFFPHIMKLKLLEPTVDIFQKIELSRQ